MIIDTDKIDDNLLEVYAYLITKNLRPNSKDEWDVNTGGYYFVEDHTLDMEKLFVDGKCVVKLGDCGKKVELENTYREIKSMKGLPTEVEDFEMTHVTIDVLDFIPDSLSYEITECKIQRIDYPFPTDVKSLFISDNLLTDFNNFPEEVFELEISGNKFTSLKGCPIVNGYAGIGYMENLTDVSDLKGDYHEAHFTSIGITSLPTFSKELKELEIRSCNNLFDVSSLLELSPTVKVLVCSCPNIDLYTLYKSKAVLKILDCPFFEMFAELFDELGHEEACKIGRLNFEEILYEKWYALDTEKWENIPFITEEINTRRNNLINSDNSVQKFNL